MRPVRRDEVVDYATYNDTRATTRPVVLALKEARRVQVGPHLTWLFENHDTMLYQIQEMMRAERIVRESNIQHEIDTYNELLGGPGELGVTLLIGIDDPSQRDVKLRQWLDLLPALYLQLTDGTKVRPRWDERQVGTDRLSAVQYLKFDVGGQTPVGAGCDHGDPELQHYTALTELQSTALREDLAGD